MFLSHPRALEELRTPRLNLRAPTRRDAKRIHEAVLETLDELVLWLPWAHPGYSLLDTRQFVSALRRLRRNGQSFDYLIEDSENGRALGMISLHRLDWLRQSAGLGYWIRRSAWGQGLATEAGHGIIDVGFRSYGLNRIEAHVAAANKASQAVIEKLRMKHEGVSRGLEKLNGEFVDHVQYAILSRDHVGGRR